MNALILELENSSKTALYIQIYQAIKKQILAGHLHAGEKLPSLRQLAESLALSLTTVEGAYNQLMVEGYIESRPRSGYFVAYLAADIPKGAVSEREDNPGFKAGMHQISSMIFDPAAFDFKKWKKCMSQVFNDYWELLHFASDPQGEYALRYEIANYLHHRRDVICAPEQIVIGAGVQQLTEHIFRILEVLNVDHVCTEMPGYAPVKKIFKDRGLPISQIPVAQDGLVIEKLPMNIRSLVYVAPSNQYPTGAVMPVGRRYALLKWAEENDSYILEDDYDSELRYFGRPIPALQGIDGGNRVIYMGSFSSTLFPAVKISYMVLPKKLSDIFHRIKEMFGQTCSKSEQLCLAVYLSKGYYDQNIRKCRRLFSQKLQIVKTCIEAQGNGRVKAVNTQSGINVTLSVKTQEPLKSLCQKGEDLGIQVRAVKELSDPTHKVLIVLYNRIPIEELQGVLTQFLQKL